MLEQDRILNFLRMTGPTLPTKVAKSINSDILMASAHLSDLSAQGKVKVSHLKIGGSPLYYLPGQEEKLYNFAQGNLNPKDVHVLNNLKEKKLLREKDLDLLSKVALRELKDFAIPLKVTLPEKTELYWKWHLLSADEANQLLNRMISGEPLEPVVEEKTALTPEAPIAVKEESEEEEETEIEPELPSNTITPLQPEIKPKPKRKKKETSDNFALEVEKFFQKSSILIDQKETLRKNQELNYFLKVPSVLGHVNYYCKVKNKAKCDEKDLSVAYMEAQSKKKPLLFLYPAELTKKAKELMDSGAFENAIISKMEK